MKILGLILILFFSICVDANGAFATHFLDSEKSDPQGMELCKKQIIKQLRIWPRFPYTWSTQYGLLEILTQPIVAVLKENNQIFEGCKFKFLDFFSELAHLRSLFDFDSFFPHIEQLLYVL